MVVFTNRKQLLKVAKLRSESLMSSVPVSCASHGGDNPLDMTSVHPESYGAARGASEKVWVTSRRTLPRAVI